MAGNRQGDVHKSFVSARLLEKHAERDEHKQRPSTDGGHGAKKSLSGKVQAVHQLVQGEAPVHEHSGHIAPQKGVDDKDPGDDAHGQSHRAAADLQHQNNEDNCHNLVPEQNLAVVGDAGDETGVIQNCVKPAG